MKKLIVILCMGFIAWSSLTLAEECGRGYVRGYDGKCWLEGERHYKLNLDGESDNDGSDWQYNQPSNPGWKMPEPMNNNSYTRPTTRKPVRKWSQGETKEQYQRRVNQYSQNHGGGCFIEIIMD